MRRTGWTAAALASALAILSGAGLAAPMPRAPQPSTALATPARLVCGANRCVMVRRPPPRTRGRVFTR